MSIASGVVDRDLCISCGACEKICPLGIISLRFREGSFRADVDAHRCVECALCEKVCPSYRYDLSSYTKDTIFTGSYLASYIAYSNDSKLREGGSSGGVVTQMIISLLERGEYKKAAVVDYDSLDGQAGYTITDSREVVVEAAKSKYVPVSTTRLLEYLGDSSYEPIIVVAVPCQIYAIRSYCKLKSIDDGRVLFLGLFCEHTLNYNIYNYYSSIYGSYDAMHFRSKYQKGWPGHTVLVRGEGKTIIDRGVRMSLKPLFKNNRCRHCFDKLNNLCDISFGDCYIKGEESFQGKSSVIVRTSRGEAALRSVSECFTYKDSPFSDVLRSQGVDKLEVDYARALQLNPDMYKNAPYTPHGRVDMGEDKLEYSKLRVGALAQSEVDYKRIERLTRRSLIKRVVGKVRRVIKKILYRE